MSVMDALTLTSLMSHLRTKHDLNLIESINGGLLFHYGILDLCDLEVDRN